MRRFTLLIVAILLIIPGMCTLAMFGDRIDRGFMQSTFIPVFLLMGAVIVVLAVFRR